MVKPYHLIGVALGIGVMMASKPEAIAEPMIAKGTLKHLIKVGESGKRGYNSYNRGSTRCAKSNRANLDISGMTLDQIAYYQALPACHSSKLLAVGFYQDIDVRRCQRRLNLSGSTIYSPAIQDKCFALYLVGDKQPAISRWITTGQNQKMAGHYASAEFSGLESPLLGRGYHDGNGNNKATVSAEKVMAALQNARAIYVKERAAGLGHEEAYTKALGVTP